MRRTRSHGTSDRVVTSETVNDDGVPQWLRRTSGYSWRFLVTLAAIAIVVFGALQVKIVLIAVFLALVITSVLEPGVTWLSRWMPRAAATALALISAILFFLGLLTYVVFSITREAPSLASQFNRGIDQILRWLEEGPLHLTVTNDDIQQWIRDGQAWLVENSGNIASTVFENVGGVAEVFMVLALGIFTTVFFLAYGSKMWIWFLGQIPVRSRLRVHEAAGAGWYTFSGYARGTVIVAVSDAMLAYILLLIVGVPLAEPLAVLVLIGAFIPLFGAPLAMIIAAVVALAALGPIEAIVVTLGIAGIGQFEGHVLQPIVMGRQVSLSPLVVAIGVLSGTALGGLFGAVIAIPVIAVSWTVYSRLRTTPPPVTEDLPSVKEIVSPTLDEQGEELPKIARRGRRHFQR